VFGRLDVGLLRRADEGVPAQQNSFPDPGALDCGLRAHEAVIEIDAPDVSFVRRTDGQYKSPRRKLCDGGFVLRSA
jgi:hypothetical protein